MFEESAHSNFSISPSEHLVIYPMCDPIMINSICAYEFCDSFSNKNFYIDREHARIVFLASHIHRGNPPPGLSYI